MELNNKSPLAFPLTLTGGKSIETVGQAAEYFSGLSEDQRERNHWKIAIRMLSNALKEPSYLKAATMSLQTALILDNVLVSPHPLDPH